MNNNRAGYLKHDGVMISEVNEIVSNSPAGIFVDATYGYGSHFNYLKQKNSHLAFIGLDRDCLLYTSPSPRDSRVSRMPSSA